MGVDLAESLFKLAWMGRICLVFLGFISCATLRGSDAGKDWGVERQFYADPITKTRIQELTQRRGRMESSSCWMTTVGGSG